MFGKKPDPTMKVIETLTPLVIKYLQDENEAQRKFEMELLKADKDYAIRRLELLTAKPKEDLTSKLQNMGPAVLAALGNIQAAGAPNG